MLRSSVSLHRPARAHKAGGCRPSRIPRLSVRAAVQSKQHQAECADISPLMPLAWTTALISSTTLPAWADEAAAPVEAAAEGVQQAAAAVTEAAADAAPAPSWLSYVVVLTPIILYGIFNVYRSQVNPRIKFSDFLFIVAGIAVVANLVSIIGFKVRLF